MVDIIYLIGILVAYATFKFFFIKEFKEWLVKDRTVALLGASLSWILVIYMVIRYLLCNAGINWDKPSKW